MEDVKLPPLLEEKLRLEVLGACEPNPLVCPMHVNHICDYQYKYNSAPITHAVELGEALAIVHIEFEGFILLTRLTELPFIDDEEKNRVVGLSNRLCFRSEHFEDSWTWRNLKMLSAAQPQLFRK
jgi:hypothetical protein